MSARARLVGILVVALAAAAAALAVAADRKHSPPPDSRSPFRGSLMPPGVPAPDFALPDERGNTIRMRALRGRAVVVAFLYTNCRDSCPIEAQLVRRALEQLGDEASRVVALAVAVDPPRDSAASARRFLINQQVIGRIRFVLGTRPQLEPVWTGFAVAPQTDESEHQARITLVDPRGMQRVGYNATDDPEDMARDLRVLLRGG